MKTKKMKKKTKGKCNSFINQLNTLLCVCSTILCLANNVGY